MLKPSRSHPPELDHYRNFIAFSNFSLPRKTTYVDRGSVDQRVLDSYKSWMKDIAEDRVYRKLHRLVLGELANQQPENASEWNRADELTRKRDSLSADKLAELQNLESTLDTNDYLTLKGRLKPKLVDEETKQVAGEYRVPGTNVSFDEAFELIEKGSSDELYQRLVDIHAEFKFRKVA